MTELVAWVTAWLPAYVLILCRTTAMVLAAPIFGQKTIPAPIRTTMALALTTVYFVASSPKAPPYDTAVAFGILMVTEIFVGLLFSYAANVIMLAIQAAGELMDVQMGLSMIMLLNPATRTQSTAIGRFFYQVATVVFLLTGGHLLLLAGFFHSFDLIPLGMSRWHDAILPNTLIDISVKIFTVGVQLAMPILVVIFVVDFGLGTMNRVSPQINVLEMNMILKPLTGATIIMLLLPTLSNLVAVLGGEMVKASNDVMKAIAGPPSGYEQTVPKGPPPGAPPGTRF